ncbi:hypothetical protein ACFXTO_014949 [Malus domestica]
MVDAGPVTPQQRQCWHVDDEELGDEEEMMKADDQKPCFSDRNMHARYVNQVWRVGFQLEDKLEKGEIERAIKKLMADDDGKEMSVRAMELKEEVDVCTRKGSSSYNFSNELVGLHHFILIASLRLEINLPC